MNNITLAVLSVVSNVVFHVQINNRDHRLDLSI